jgi:hypothetical protein
LINLATAPVPILPLTVCREVLGMRWRSVAIAGALWPAAAGCNIAHNAARNFINEPHVVWTQHALKHELKSSAKAAWETARFDCPEHADSDAFRDGFIDGYVDYLDRGGNGSLPAVPPAKYTRHKEYFTENGQCLVKEYFLGFKHGQEVAIATGRRPLLTVPVLLPLEPTGPPAFTIAPAGDGGAPPMIPPRPLEGVEPTSSSTSRVPPVVVPRDSGVFRAPPRDRSIVIASGRKSSPPSDFSPITKPLLVSVRHTSDPEEFPASAVAEPETAASGAPLPLPPRTGPSGPEAWGALPAIPPATSGPSVPTPRLPPPVDRPTPRVTPPNHPTPLPPNHPAPNE